MPIILGLGRIETAQRLRRNGVFQYLTGLPALLYNSRAQAELVIRELKEAYALGKIPSRRWEVNETYFHLVVFAYNLLNWFRRLCVPPEL